MGTFPVLLLILIVSLVVLERLGISCCCHLYCSDGDGVSIPYGAVSTRWMSVFVPGLSGLYMYANIYDQGMEPYHPRVRQDLVVVPGGSSQRALAPQPAKQQSVCGGGVFTAYGAVSTRGMTVFVPRWLELYMHGRISD